MEEGVLSKILTEIPDPVFITRARDGLILYVNEAFTRVSRYTEEEVVGKTVLALNLWVNPQDREAIVTGIKRAGRVTGLEIDYRFKDGNTVSMSVSCELIDIGGESHLLSTGRDITERKRAEAEPQKYRGDLEQRVEDRTLELRLEIERRNAAVNAAEDSTKRLRTILETSPFGVGVSRLEDGIFQFANKKNAELFGTTVEDMLGKSAKRFWADSKDRKKFLDIFNREGRVSGVEVQQKRADGSLFWAVLSWERIPVFSDDAILFWVHDISHSKQAEQESERARLEAEVANRAKSEFLSRMSHELRTPMNAVLGFAQLLELDAESLTDIQRNNVREIRESGRHLLALINDMLDLAKIESGEMTISTEEVLVDEVLRQSISLVGSQMEARQVTLIDRICGNGYTVLADTTRLKQVFVNLLSNAIKYNREGGRITLVAEYAGKQRLRFRITDTGLGLPEEEIDRLFMPFERLNASDNVEGTGIGLVISKYLIELMGGTIGVESTPGEGSSFWVELVEGIP